MGAGLEQSARAGSESADVMQVFTAFTRCIRRALGVFLDYFCTRMKMGLL
jgi:hypothetical protein